MINIILAIITGLVLLFIIIVCALPNVRKDYKFADGLFAGICVSLLFVIELGIISDIVSEPIPTAMDVYQGKTTLEYKVVDDVKVDSVVVFKNNKTMIMEKIDIEWCKQHGMTFAKVNVARDTSYYLEKDGDVIFVYTQSTNGEQKIYVRNPLSGKEAELTVPIINRDLDKLNILTTDDLNKLCELIDLEYPFK